MVIENSIIEIKRNAILHPDAEGVALISALDAAASAAAVTFKLGEAASYMSIAAQLSAVRGRANEAINALQKVPGFRKIRGAA